VAKRVHVFISGQVQGVGFRWFCRDEALSRRLAGFVKNLPDGRVEAAFEGDPTAVDGMVDWCRMGPDYAKVDEVDARKENLAGDRGFVISR
jgi:acylphosphatase